MDICNKIENDRCEINPWKRVQLVERISVQLIENAALVAASRNESSRITTKVTSRWLFISLAITQEPKHGSRLVITLLISNQGSRLK